MALGMLMMTFNSPVVTSESNCVLFLQSRVLPSLPAQWPPQRISMASSTFEKTSKDLHE